MRLVENGQAIVVVERQFTAGQAAQGIIWLAHSGLFLFPPDADFNFKSHLTWLVLMSRQTGTSGEGSHTGVSVATRGRTSFRQFELRLVVLAREPPCYHVRLCLIILWGLRGYSDPNTRFAFSCRSDLSI